VRTDDLWIGVCITILLISTTVVVLSSVARPGAPVPEAVPPVPAGLSSAARPNVGMESPLAMHAGPLEGLNAWSSTVSYPVSGSTFGGESCVTSSGYVYCVGGNTAFGGTYFAGSPTNATYYAALTGSGIASWLTTTAYPFPVDGLSCVTNDSYIYCVGGAGGYNSPSTSSVYYAPLSSGGIGTWAASTSYPVAIQLESCVASAGVVFCITGDVGYSGSSTDVYYAPLSSGGVGSWASGTAYPSSDAGPACVADSGLIYCVAGDLGSGATIYYATATSSGVGSWGSVNNYPFSSALGVAAVTEGAEIYTVGGCVTPQPGCFTPAVAFAPLSASGVGAWTGNNSFPVASYDDCVASTPYIYCIAANSGVYFSYVIESNNTVISSDVSLSSDLAATNLTIDPGVTLTTDGFDIFVSDVFDNRGTISTGFDSTGSQPYSSGGSGGGSQSLAYCSLDENGSSTLVTGGNLSCSNAANGGNGSTPVAPSLGSALIQSWYSGGLPSYLAGAGGGGVAGYLSGGAGAFGLYLQASTLVAGNISAVGQAGSGTCSGIGLTGGGGGGVVLLAYGPGGFLSGNDSVAGGAPAPSCSGLVWSGAGGSGQYLPWDYGAAPPIPTTLIPPNVPAVSASVLDVNQALTVTATVPGSGTAPYSWQWWMSSNGGIFGTSTPCATATGSGASGGATELCNIAANALTPGDTYTFEFQITDSATAPQTAISTGSEIVSVSSKLQAPGAPTLSATALDRNQALTVTGSLPSTGSAPYSWQWLVSVNGGSYLLSKHCTSPSGNGGTTGEGVSCAIVPNALTTGDAYRFELRAIDNATLPEKATSASTPGSVMVSAALAAPLRPTVSTKSLLVTRALTVKDSIPTTGTATYSYQWLVSINGAPSVDATICAVSSGTGLSGGASVTCSIAANTLTVGNTYAFALRVTDGATVSEQRTSGASPTVTVKL